MISQTFNGYRRPDGRVGIRNHVLILPTSICASDICEHIARAVDGCISFHNQNGCSQIDRDRDVTIAAEAGFAANPNVYGTILIFLGCGTCQNDTVYDEIKKRTNKPIECLVIQQVGGSLKAIEEGTRRAQHMRAQADECERTPTPISELIFGTNCGGSDPSSVLGANPLIGACSDWLVEHDATSVLCETPELFGAEDILARRAKPLRLRKNCSRLFMTMRSMSTCLVEKCARVIRVWATNVEDYHARGEIAWLCS